jgi:hypothetical protein
METITPFAYEVLKVVVSMAELTAFWLGVAILWGMLIVGVASGGAVAFWFIRKLWREFL